MLTNKNMQETKGRPKYKIQLYADDAYTDKPIYDSDEVPSIKSSIAEDLKQLGDLADLIEDDFLELECIIVIEFDEQDEIEEESKEEQPQAKKSRRATLVMDAKESDNYDGS